VGLGTQRILAKLFGCQFSRLSRPGQSVSCGMRRSCQVFTLFFLLATGLLAAPPAAPVAVGQVKKVLPHFLDLKGRHALSPSLYDRDAYQLELRKHPEKRSGIRFDVLWKGRGAGPDAPGVVRVELRGSAKGDLPTEKKLELAVRLTGGSQWTQLTLAGTEYQKFGEITAWRVTIWAGEEMIGEQKSFLW
jgi:hypothetical protein